MRAGLDDRSDSGRHIVTHVGATEAGSLKISFPELSPAEASIVAQELNAALVNAGVPRDAITVARSRQDTQLLGDILVVAAVAALPYLDAFLKGAAHKAGERALDAILRKWGTSARIERDGAPATVVGQHHRRPGKGRTPEQAHALAEMNSLGVVLLGANSFPHFPRELRYDNDTFGRSAQLIRNLLCSNRTVFQETHVLDLFDQDQRPEQIVDSIEDFLAAHRSVRDVIIYYCGHGAFQENRERTFYVLLRGTRPDRTPITGLDPKAFKTMIDANAVLSSRRCTLILDCCFAARAVDAFQFASLEPMIERQLADLPSRGFALLAASGRDLPAIAPRGSDATMFAAALAEVLNSNGPTSALSLGDLCHEMTTLIKSKHGQNGVLPQCHAVDQSDGDLTRIPIFLRGIASVAERETSEPRIASYRPEPYGYYDDSVSVQEDTIYFDIDNEDEEPRDGFVGYSEFVSGDEDLFRIADGWVRSMTPHELYRVIRDLDSEDENIAFSAIDTLAKAQWIYPDLVKFRIIAWCAIWAHTQLFRGADYIVKGGQIMPIDEQGREIPGERLGFGYHQAVQAKEHVEIT